MTRKQSSSAGFENKYKFFSDKITLFQKLIWIVVLCALIYGLYRAISLAWVCDDAFISFRYAKNLLNGDGLVFNIGERVEGYSNFLWTLIIAAGLACNFEPILFSQILSIFSYLFSVIIFIFLAVRFSEESFAPKPMIIPFTAIMLLLSYDMHVYATSGLETSLATMLISLGFTTLLLTESKRGYFWAGIILILTALTRPDGMIFYMMALPYIVLTARRKTKVLYYLIPLVLIYAPYWIWRYNYYGWFFPNTYYAKSANLSNYIQGWKYLTMYFDTYYLLYLLFPVGLATILILIRKFIMGRTIILTDRMDKIRLLSLLFVVPYIFYVVRVGGDFMFARFFILITPLSFFFLEVSLFSISRFVSWRLFVGLLMILAIVFRQHQFEPANDVVEGIVDERMHYPAGTIEKAKRDGGNLQKCLGGLDVNVGFYGSKAMTMYYAELPTAIECEAGLTDAYIAHRLLKNRGRPGHEKKAPYEYLLERKVNFIIKTTRPNYSKYDSLRYISFEQTEGYIVYYDNNIMKQLSNNRSVKFDRIEGLIDEFIDNVDSIPPEYYRSVFTFFKSYYFDFNSDPVRFEALVKIVNKAEDGKKEKNDN